MSGPRTIFMGTPPYVVPVLNALQGLVEEGQLELVGVYTGQAQRAGRGLSLKTSEVADEAKANGIPVMTPKRLGDPAVVEQFRELEPQLVVLAAYGLLLPRPFLREPKHGAINVHPSLLPRHRGASPVAAAILWGDNETGTTLIQMDEGLDTGPILGQRVVPMLGDEQTGQLTTDLFKLGAAMLFSILPTYLRGEIPATRQPDQGATWTTKLSKADGDIDWTEPAGQIEREIRAYSPWPGTASRWRGSRIQILRACVLHQVSDLPPGTVVEEAGYPAVVTGAGRVVLKVVKLEGRRAMDGAEFLRGQPGVIGSRIMSIG